MKYFVIHSGGDLEKVKALTRSWSEAYENAQFVMLDGGQQNWQGDAIARIRECGKVLYVVGEKSADSPFIQIELDIAAREKKDVYVYRLNEEYRINDCLKNKKSRERVGECEGETVICKEKDRVFVLDEKGLDLKLKKDSEEIEVILKAGGFTDKDVVMQQYTMFVETSEELVRRKQSVNTFYVTLNSILLSAVVSILCASSEAELFKNPLVVYVLSAVLSVMGVVICCSWITLLRSYADLNASKMAIIGCIEEHLALKLYDTEWAILTRKIGNKKYKSFTVKEIAVAKIFLALYVITVASCIVLLFI
jgi:hypothetical protein